MKIKELQTSVLANNKGTTLAELMISVVISTFIILTAAVVLQQVVALKLNASKRTTIEEDLDLLLVRLQQLTKYAVNVRYYNNDLDGRGNAQGQGFVRSFSYRTSSGFTKPSTTLMFFAREVARSRTNPNTLQSQFALSAVYFRPKIENPTNARKPSAIVIDTNNASAAVLELDDSDYAFEYISDVVLDDPVIAAGVLQSIKMTVSVVYPLSTTAIGLDCYGPSQDIAGGLCNQSKPYKILEKSVVLSFLNNKRNTPKSSYEFSEGFYMFPPSTQQ